MRDISFMCEMPEERGVSVTGCRKDTRWNRRFSVDWTPV